ncbi:MAG TPA: DinB family protein [Pseudonocardiaceae bacterium]
MPGQVRPVADEREGLLAYLAQQRDAVRIAAHGLTDEQARATPAVSALSIGGLIKHLAATERGWLDTVLQRDRGGTEEAESNYHDGFRLTPDETLADVLARYDEVAKETEAIIAGIADLGQPVPVPKGVPWFPDDVEAWSVRWVLLHLIEETARHAGHADIVRESVDGATAYELMAAAEGWPATEWLTPWQPPSPSE